MQAHPLFRQAHFLLAAAELSQLPADIGNEVCFAGRSNAGKSSVINAITGISKLARTSKTPGRTQQLVFFDLDALHRLVDLPGYGYAKVAKSTREHWHTVIDGYLQRRRSLRGLVLIMDVRHPLTEFDEQMVSWCESTKTPLHVVLTKADKLGRGAASAQLLGVKQRLKSCSIQVDAQLFSSLRIMGKEILLSKLETWLELNPHPVPVDPAGDISAP